MVYYIKNKLLMLKTNNATRMEPHRASPWYLPAQAGLLSRPLGNNPETPFIYRNSSWSSGV